jgi:hypothetical protein
MCYFFFFWLFSKVFSNDIGNLFEPTFRMRVVWLIIFFSVMSVYLGELWYSNCKRCCKTDEEPEEDRQRLLGDNLQ